jgi:hypothetical protein
MSEPQKTTMPSASTNPVGELPPSSTMVPAFEEMRMQAECAKLKAETAVLLRPVYQHIQFWTSLMGVLLAVAGIVIPWFSGWFDLKQLEVKNATMVLEAENKRLLAQKETVLADTAKLGAERTALSGELKLLDERRQTQIQIASLLTNQISLLERSRDEKEKLLAEVNNKMASLADENAKLRPVLLRVQELEMVNQGLSKSNQLASSYLKEALNAARDTTASVGEAMEAYKNNDVSRLARSIGEMLGRQIRLNNIQFSFFGEKATPPPTVIFQQTVKEDQSQ